MRKYDMMPSRPGGGHARACAALVLAVALFALVCAPRGAAADGNTTTVTVGGLNYTVGTITNVSSFSPQTARLAKTPWFMDDRLGRDLCTAVGADLGTNNSAPPGGPVFIVA